MGMFDSVYFTCTCGEKIEAQSKGGACNMDEYNPLSVPADVAGDLEIYNPCKKCGKKWRVEKSPMPNVRVDMVESDKTFGEELRERWAATAPMGHEHG